MTTKGFVFLIVLVTACHGQQSRTANDLSQEQTVHQLFIEDQADREAPGGELTKLDWSKIGLAMRRGESGYVLSSTLGN
jgi:hypothetical protein